MTDNYIPFGEEWVKAVMTLPKARIIDLYKKSAQQSSSLLKELEAARVRVKELEDEIKGWISYKQNIDEALNSGDGVYRP